MTAPTRTPPNTNAHHTTPHRSPLTTNPHRPDSTIRLEGRLR